MEAMHSMRFLLLHGQFRSRSLLVSCSALKLFSMLCKKARDDAWSKSIDTNCSSLKC